MMYRAKTKITSKSVGIPCLSHILMIESFTKMVADRLAEALGSFLRILRFEWPIKGYEGNKLK